MTPFVNEALRQLVPFFHSGLFQVIDSSGRLVAEGHPKQHNPPGYPGCLVATSEAR